MIQAEDYTISICCIVERTKNIRKEKRAMKDGQFRATDNIEHKTQNEDKHNYTIQKTIKMTNTSENHW